LNRYSANGGTSTQGFQQYFSNQPHHMQSKYEVRAGRNVHIFDEKLGYVRSIQLLINSFHFLF
jgi:hypothetical protein